MFRKSFRKKKSKKDNCEDDQSTSESSDKTKNKLENYHEAVQLVATLQSENRKLRLELEYLKHAASPSQTNLPTIVSGPTQETRRSFTESQVTTELQRDVHENCNLRLQEQQATITDLSARLKETEDKLRKKDAADQILYEVVHRLDSTLKNKFEDKKKLSDTLERLENKIDADSKRDDSLKQRPDYIIKMLTQQCKALDEALEKEMKQHSHLLMKVNEINKGQTDIREAVDSVQESTEEISSKLTELLAESKRSNVNHNNLPAHVLGFAFRIEKKLDDKDKVMKFGLALGLNSSAVEKLVNEESGKVFWDVLYEWNKTSQSVADLISACQRLSICPFSDGLMPPHHTTAIEKAYSRLEADIFVSYVVSHLRDHAVLSLCDVDYILSPETRTETFRRLVDILPLFGEKAFDCLVDALIKTGQHHLAEILLDELKELTTLTGTLNMEYKTVVERSLQPELTTVNESLSLNESDVDITRLLSTILTAVNYNKELLMKNDKTLSRI